MNFKEKEKILIDLLDKDEYKDSDLEQIIMFSKDSDEYIRQLVAELLINFSDSNVARKTLLELACDKDEMVRLEAYDSLSEFNYEDVEVFLHNAMFEECDELACSYAIMAWAEIVKCMHTNYYSYLLEINKLVKNDKVKNSEHCMLNCAYAKYLFGDEEGLIIIFSYLESKDYHIRCAVVNTLRDIVDTTNKDVIIDTLLKKVTGEEINSVKMGLIDFLLQFDNM